jgi:hypothetical protein
MAIMIDNPGKHWYVGKTKKGGYVPFSSARKPIRSKFPQYRLSYGPFENKRDAQQWAMAKNGEFLGHTGPMAIRRSTFESKFSGIKPVETNPASPMFTKMMSETKPGDILSIWVQGWGGPTWTGAWIRGQNTVYVLTTLYDVGVPFSQVRVHGEGPLGPIVKWSVDNHVSKLPDWARNSIIDSAIKNHANLGLFETSLWAPKSNPLNSQEQDEMRSVRDAYSFEVEYLQREGISPFKRMDLLGRVKAYDDILGTYSSPYEENSGNIEARDWRGRFTRQRRLSGEEVEWLKPEEAGLLERLPPQMNPYIATFTGSTKGAPTSPYEPGDRFVLTDELPINNIETRWGEEYRKLGWLHDGKYILDWVRGHKVHLADAEWDASGRVTFHSVKHGHVVSMFDMSKLLRVPR